MNTRDLLNGCALWLDGAGRGSTTRWSTLFLNYSLFYFPPFKKQAKRRFEPATSDHKECKQYHWTITSVAMM